MRRTILFPILLGLTFLVAAYSGAAEPNFTSKDPFQILGVERGESEGGIRRQYLNLIKLYRPDTSSQNISTEEKTRITAILNKAFEDIKRGKVPPASSAEPLDVYWAEVWKGIGGSEIEIKQVLLTEGLLITHQNMSLYWLFANTTLVNLFSGQFENSQHAERIWNWSGRTQVAFRGLDKKRSHAIRDGLWEFFRLTTPRNMMQLDQAQRAIVGYLLNAENLTTEKLIECLNLLKAIRMGSGSLDSAENLTLAVQQIRLKDTPGFFTEASSLTAEQFRVVVQAFDTISSTDTNLNNESYALIQRLVVGTNENRFMALRRIVDQFGADPLVLTQKLQSLKDAKLDFSNEEFAKYVAENGLPETLVKLQKFMAKIDCQGLLLKVLGFQ